MPEKVEETAQADDATALQGKKGKVTAAAPPPAAAKKEEQKTIAAKVEPIVNDPAIFERAVFFMPYKSPEFVKKLQDSFYEINIAAGKIEAGGLRAISTKKLTEEER